MEGTKLSENKNNDPKILQSDEDASEFFLVEITRMERFYSRKGENALNPEFCQEVAKYFSCSERRKGKSSIQCEQVQSWFKERHNKALAEEKSVAERIASLSNLRFEAKSAKDDGWYDVASFINYRTTHDGELEVHVRFVGFNYDEDEWINVKRGVRERSIHLEPSEYQRVKVGDRTLCFRETDSFAIYYDAEILAIHITSHDDSCCSCSFVIRYYYDLVEEHVGLSKICIRPT